MFADEGARTELAIPICLSRCRETPGNLQLTSSTTPASLQQFSFSSRAHVPSCCGPIGQPCSTNWNVGASRARMTANCSNSNTTPIASVLIIIHAPNSICLHSSYNSCTQLQLPPITSVSLQSMHPTPIAYRMKS